MELRRDQEEFYRNTLAEVRSQIDEIDVQIEEQIKSIKSRLSELQNSKKALMSVCQSLSKILGEEIVSEEPHSVLSSIKTA